MLQVSCAIEVALCSRPFVSGCTLNLVFPKTLWWDGSLSLRAVDVQGQTIACPGGSGK